MAGFDNPLFAPLGGVIIGLIMGYVARRNYFCSMTSLERHWYVGDSSGFRSWGLAAATALAATLVLQMAGIADLSLSIYHTEPVPIAGAILGGLMFGFGMALVGTCSFGSIIRFGGGSLNGLVVMVVIGLSGLAAQRGLTGHVRQNLLAPFSLDMTGLGAASPGSLFSASEPMFFSIGIVVFCALLIWAFMDAGFRSDKTKITTGIIIGLCIAASWAITSTAHHASFEPVQVQAISYVAPVGDTIMQLITVTGAWPSFGVGIIFGTVVGAFIAAKLKDELRWEACDNARELGRHILGAFLMGTGGVFALGCTVGQGLSAVSALSLSAPIAIASIIIGARFGLSLIMEGSITSFLRSSKNSAAE